ncbi:hypothetical protein FHU38_005230 [Saccharomonospora amisosensis]|uniref:Uncharacterized protein n=1 Tax=Saccharomonospora amisosensis TaxID=1128677 RepID=A0A7X5UV31_9PSEU|nr:hypothetical protein [Saccharomonospora amisosensis]
MKFLVRRFGRFLTFADHVCGYVVPCRGVLLVEQYGTILVWN